MVLLEHVLPDGSRHYDWLLARDAAGDRETRDVLTLRCATRIDRLAVHERCEVEWLPDHRRHYLDHEGPVGNGRGAVRRVASGEVVAAAGLAGRERPTPSGGSDDAAQAGRDADRNGSDAPPADDAPPQPGAERILVVRWHGASGPSRYALARTRVAWIEPTGREPSQLRSGDIGWTLVRLA